MDRYSRQQRIEGWDQSRLSAATLGIAGSGRVAFLTALMATAMGFGRIILLGKPRCHTDSSGTLKGLINASAEEWGRFLHDVNPEVDVFPIWDGLSPARLGRIPELDGLIAAGNDRDCWELAAHYASEGGDALAAGSAGQVAICGPPRIDAIVEHLFQLPESPIMSQIAAGLLVDDIRKMLLPLPHEVSAEHNTTRRCVSFPALGRPQSGTPSRRALPRGSAVTVIGAGALANWFGIGLGLADLPCTLHIYDEDEIEETNLNRQVLFSGAVGRPKGPTLAARLDRLFAAMRTYGYGMHVEEQRRDQVAASPVLASCPDNFGVRALANDWVRNSQTGVLINGGTSAWGGSAMTYAPGDTCCLSCLMDIDGLASRETETQACGRVVEASVVTSNAIVGALMAAAVRDLFAGKVRRGIWEYDSRSEGERIGVHSIRPPCDCHLKR